MTHGTARALGDAASSGAVIVDSHTPFPVGDLEVRPFLVSHDARESVQLVVTDGARRLGILTDTGAAMRHIEVMLFGCDAFVLECNHDPHLLASGLYL